MGLDDFETDDSGRGKDPEQVREELTEFLRDNLSITSSAIEDHDEYPSVATVKKQLKVDDWEDVLEEIGFWELNKWRPDKEWRPTATNQQLLHIAYALLRDERRTVRDVYYALESRGYDYEYETVNNALKEGRRHGWINPSWVIDTSRLTMRSYSEGYQSPKAFVEEEVKGIQTDYFENWWAGMDEYVEVWVEKASLESVFRPICEEYNVPLLFMGGNWSDSKIYRAIDERLQKRLLESKDITILYFGDFNGSGLHAPVAIQNTMKHYGIDMHRDEVGADHPDYFAIAPSGRVTPALEVPGEPGTFIPAPGTIKFERVALTLEQIRDEYPDLPTNPLPSESEKSKQEQRNLVENVTYEFDVPNADIELNALKEFHREDLKQMIEDAILDHLDEDVMEEVSERTERRKELIGEAVSVDSDVLKESDE